LGTAGHAHIDVLEFEEGLACLHSLFVDAIELSRRHPLAGLGLLDDLRVTL